MNSRSKYLLLIIAILLIAILAVTVSWSGMAMRESSTQHRYGYTITIYTRSTIHNVTMILPVPSVNGTSEIGEALVRGEGYGVPSGWNLSLVEYREIPMLMIETPVLVPEYHAYPIPIEPGQAPNRTPPPTATAYSEDTPILIPLECGLGLEVNRTIDTRNPAAHEPLLYPKTMVKTYNGESQADRAGSSNSDSPGPGEEQDPEFLVPLYITCNSNQPVDIEISVAITGINEWWELGWRGNSYSERIIASIQGNETGWIYAKGRFDSGGVYRTGL